METWDYVDWGGRVWLDWLSRAEPLPPVELVTSAHSLCFLDGKVMLVDVRGRGLGVPGGHREPGESAEQCVTRETMEEGYVRGLPTLVGMARVDHGENPNWRPDGKYPRVGYQVYDRIDIKEVLPFAAAFESDRRLFVSPEEVQGLHQGWNRMLHHALQTAIEHGERALKPGVKTV